MGITNFWGKFLKVLYDEEGNRMVININIGLDWLDKLYAKFKQTLGDKR